MLFEYYYSTISFSFSTSNALTISEVNDTNTSIVAALATTVQDPDM